MNTPSSKGEFRSGFIAVVGRPNVGKSTLINALLSQTVAAVSPRPQTTRRRQLGILTLSNAQVVFVDTPGLHRPVHKLGHALNRAAEAAIQDADTMLVVCDVSEPVRKEDRMVAEAVEAVRPAPAVVLALNKVDLVGPGDLETRGSAFRSLFPRAAAQAVSAGQKDLVDRIVERLPEGPAYYPEDAVTDAHERDLAGDLIRSAALGLLRDEVPHSLAVQVEEYRERNESSAYIAATLLVERESQKGIVIGRGGSMLKDIGMRARAAIEDLTHRQIYLDLRVRVLPNWRDDPQALRRLGFETPPARRKTPR